jgi:hypothetical protein
MGFHVVTSGMAQAGSKKRPREEDEENRLDLPRYTEDSDGVYLTLHRSYLDIPPLHVYYIIYNI